MTGLKLASHALVNSTRQAPFSVSRARNLSSPVFVVWQEYGGECSPHEVTDPE
jgi:hypothetical protein